MSEENFYRCIPELNKECKKNNCYINGGECEMTIRKEYTLKGLLEEIERLKNINEEHRILNGKLRVENSRLNNIINELEKWLRNEYSKYNGAIRIASVLDKIQELKGEDKE